MSDIVTSPKMREMLDFVLSRTNPEKIYLLGYGTHERIDFIEVGNSLIQVQDLQLLVILPVADAGKEERLMMELNKVFKDGFRLACIAVNISVYNDWLKKGQLFAYAVDDGSVLVYEKTEGGLFKPFERSNTFLENKLRQETHFYLQRAEEMRKGADFFYNNYNSTIAAYMLQQAAELLLMCIIRATTGYRLSTHSISLLTHVAQAFYGFPATIYGEDIGEHHRVMKWLDKSYIGSRYKPEFTVSKQVFQSMIKGIDNLFELSNPLIQEVRTSSSSKQTASPA